MEQLIYASYLTFTYSVNDRNRTIESEDIFDFYRYYIITTTLV